METTQSSEGVPDDALLQTTVAIMNHDWFGSLVPVRHGLFEVGMTLLLLNVYVAAKRGRPLAKRRACRLSRMDEFKTGPKYITAAIELGLLFERRSTVDKRQILLFPTEQLDRRIQGELRRFASKRK